MTNRPARTEPHPAAPGPVARAEAPLARPPRSPPPRFDTSPPAPAAARILPPAHRPRSICSSSRFFSKRKPHQEPRPPPIFHRALEFELATRIRRATDHDRQSQARPLRLCGEKRLNYFISQLRRNSRPVIFHRHQTDAVFPRDSYVHVPASRRRVQRVYHQVCKNVVQRLRADGRCDGCGRRMEFQRDAFALRFGTQNTHNFPRYFRSEEHTSELQSPCNL